MPGLEAILAAATSSPSSPCLLAYGPAPGMELIPYFLGLLGWVALAFGAILLSPISALLRRFRKGKSAPQAEPKGEPMTASAREPQGETTHDRT